MGTRLVDGRLQQDVFLLNPAVDDADGRSSSGGGSSSATGYSPSSGFDSYCGNATSSGSTTSKTYGKLSTKSLRPLPETSTRIVKLSGSATASSG